MALDGVSQASPLCLPPEPKGLAPGPARLAEVGMDFCLPICVGLNGASQRDMSKS